MLLHANFCVVSAYQEQIYAYVLIGLVLEHKCTDANVHAHLLDPTQPKPNLQICQEGLPVTHLGMRDM